MTLPSRHRDLLAAVLLLLAAGAFFYPLLLGQVLLPDHLLGAFPWALEQARGPHHAWNPLQWDALAQYYPWRVFLIRNLHQGRLPFWNPYAFCGMPFLANGQSSVLYPLTWLFFLLGPTAQAFGWSTLFHFGLAGIFTYAFLRLRGTRRSAALAGALAYQFCGFLVAWAELPTLTHTATWLPAVFAGLERTRQRPSPVGAALAGLALGLAALAGHLQVFLFVGLAALSYGLWRLGTRRHLHLLGLAVGLGGLIASAQLLPSWELARHSHRPGLATETGYQGYRARALPTYNLVTAFLPNYFGNPTRGDYWGFVQVSLPDGRIAWSRNPADYMEFCLYLGVFPLFLGLYAALFRRDRVSHYLTALACAALLLALGTFPNRLFFFHVPGFAGFGGPSRIILLGLFAGAVLTGLGLDQWGNDPPPRRRKRGGIVLALVSAAFLGTSLHTTGLLRSLGLSMHLRRALLPGDLIHFGVFFLLSLVWLGLTGWEWKRKRRWLLLFPGALIYADLWLFGHAFNPTSSPASVYPPSSLAESLRAQAGLARVLPQLGRWSLTQLPHPVLPPNSGMVLGLYDVQGYDSLYLREYKAWMNAAEGGEASPPENGNMLRLTQFASPLLDLLGVRYVLSRTEITASGWRYAQGEVLKVYENLQALPRAWVVHRAVRVAPRQALRNHLLAPDFDPRKTVLLGPYREIPSPSPPFFPGESAAGGQVQGEAWITSYEANRVALVALLPLPGYVVLSDVAFPGWAVYVDGESQPWQRGDGFLRAVALPSGQHPLTFVYRPLAVRLGLFLLGLGGMGLGGVGGWWWGGRWGGRSGG